MTATGYTTDARAVSSVEGRTGAVDVVKADVGLGSVDNTADLAKPVSTATQTALDGKANTSHVHSGADITSGTVPVGQLPTGSTGSTVSLGNHTHAVATGGTGLTSVTANSYVKGNGTAALVERTYAQVRTDLGFDAVWTAPDTFAANMTNAGSPWYDVGAWISPDGEHHWRGRVLAGANYTANATIFTLAAGVRPVRDVEFQIRSIGVGAAAGFLKVTAATGAVSFSASITVGAASGWPLDGIKFWGGAN